jgi:hypothetical protein
MVTTMTRRKRPVPNPRTDADLFTARQAYADAMEMIGEMIDEGSAAEALRGCRYILSWCEYWAKRGMTSGERAQNAEYAAKYRELIPKVEAVVEEEARLGQVH